MDAILQFTVTNQELECTDEFIVVEGSENYLQAQFTFTTPDWDGLIKTAVFIDKGGDIHPSLCADDTCDVPPEWLVEQKGFVGLIGSDGSTKITTKAVKINIAAKGYTSGGQIEEETQAYFDQLLAAFSQKYLETEAQAKLAKRWAVGLEEEPETLEDNASYYASQAHEDALRTSADQTAVGEMKTHVDSVGAQVDFNKQATAQYKSQASQSAENASQSEQNAKDSETAAQTAQEAAESAENQARLYANQTSADRETVSADKAIVLSARDEAITARNTAIENANIAVNKADETEADKQSTEANKAATEANKQATAENLAESNRILQEQIQMLGTVPMIYAVTTLEELQAFTGAKDGDFGIIQEPRAMLFRYYTTGADGQPLSQPAWQWMTDLNITFTRESLLGILNLAGIALTGSYADLQDIPNRYNSPIVLDGTADTITWDYSQSDTALVTLTADKPLTITGDYNGCRGVIDVYGAKLILDDAVYLKSATFPYLEALEGVEHYHYEFQKIIDKWQVGMMVVAGGAAE